LKCPELDESELAVAGGIWEEAVANFKKRKADEAFWHAGKKL
jgi:3-keto-L-gulonate-6-phosphate decarboxylase